MKWGNGNLLGVEIEIKSKLSETNGFASMEGVWVGERIFLIFSKARPKNRRFGSKRAWAKLLDKLTL